MKVRGGVTKRHFGTKHREAGQSAKNLLSKFPHRISDAEGNRVLEVVQGAFGQNTHGSQPSLLICRRSTSKRKPPRHQQACVDSNQGLCIEQGMVAGLHYLLRVPAGHDRGAPLLFFLHGAGERGSDDGTELSRVLRHGPWQSNGAAQFYILAPQCPHGRVWPALVDAVLLLLADVCKRHVVDEGRIYITGLSMGAFGAWSVVASQPQTFAAIVPICGGFPGASMPIATTLAQMLSLATKLHLCRARQVALEKCKGIPVWLFHGWHQGQACKS